jgi:integrase
MEKPSKPYPQFPLFPHASGQWAKKILGKVHYFGKWDDWEAALRKFNKEHTYLFAGERPPSDTTTLRDVLNGFLKDKKSSLETGKISERTFKEYKDVCDVIATLGKDRPIASVLPPVLESLKHRLAIGKNGDPLSPVSHKRLLTFARMVFLYANEVMGCSVRYRRPLRPPEQKLIRQQRAKVGEQMFTAAQIRKLVTLADPQLKAMIYLGINCGFGPTDCINLPSDKVGGGWHIYGRPKTGVARRCPLWPETQAALVAIITGPVVFNGRVWNRHVIAREFRKLCEAGKFYKKDVTTFYSLRRTFETIAKNSGVNQSVIDKIMGHERPDMSEVYNQKVFDQQLRKCTDFVRRWLSGSVKVT